MIHQNLEPAAEPLRVHILGYAFGLNIEARRIELAFFQMQTNHPDQAEVASHGCLGIPQMPSVEQKLFRTAGGQVKLPAGAGCPPNFWELPPPPELAYVPNVPFHP